MPAETVGSVAELYLGNILYAIELAALSLEEQGKPEDAAFYRGIGRKMAEARGREREEGRESREAGGRERR
ncbi:MAG TPA: hypothetical protein VFW98_11330 [Gemmatimonadaceae bacterium]|nr:hypothetical protein [Gemmatimonadaceae bacterium]